MPGQGTPGPGPPGLLVTVSELPTPLILAGRAWPSEALSNQLSCRQVFKRSTDRFEQRDLTLGPPPRIAPPGEVKEIAHDVAFAYDAVPDGLNDVAGLSGSSLARIDEDAGPPHNFIVCLTHVRPEASHQVNVLTGP